MTEPVSALPVEPEPVTLGMLCHWYSRSSGECSPGRVRQRGDGVNPVVRIALDGSYSVTGDIRHSTVFDRSSATGIDQVTKQREVGATYHRVTECAFGR